MAKTFVKKVIDKVLPATCRKLSCHNYVREGSFYCEEHYDVNPIVKTIYDNEYDYNQHRLTFDAEF